MQIIIPEWRCKYICSYHIMYFSVYLLIQFAQAIKWYKMFFRKRDNFIISLYRLTLSQEKRSMKDEVPLSSPRVDYFYGGLLHSNAAKFYSLTRW